MSRSARTGLTVLLIRRWAALAYFLATWAILALGKPATGSELPYGTDSLIIYDNDEAVDVYSDEYLLALSSVGKVKLISVITTVTLSADNPWIFPKDPARIWADRETLLSNAIASEFQHVPPHYHGANTVLIKPSSGLIEDTVPIGSDGSWVIVNNAREATAKNPLLVVVGGTLTTVVDAYLLDPTIADKFVIAWIGGRVSDMGDYNGWADTWAAYIALQRLRLVQFVERTGVPRVPKADILNFPQNPLRDWMYQKHHPRNSDPEEQCLDSPPAISIVRPDYAATIRRVVFNGWVDITIGVTHSVPAFHEDPDGRMLVVSNMDAEISTAEWWRALNAAMRGAWQAL